MSGASKVARYRADEDARVRRAATERLAFAKGSDSNARHQAIKARGGTRAGVASVERTAAHRASAVCCLTCGYYVEVLEVKRRFMFCPGCGLPITRWE
jgi:predicted RNA-binding Zn-ribbon protein involved in translation (DUF1610 family)